MTTIATLFSGGEGVGVGAHMAGLEHLWGIEYDAAIADVARANGFHTITADVTQVDWSTLPAPDILHASPPCPNFSVAKTNRGETEQDRAVAQAVCDAITTLMPPTWCEPKAWSRMIDSVQAWIATYGDLRRWQELRHAKASEL